MKSNDYNMIQERRKSVDEEALGWSLFSHNIWKGISRQLPLNLTFCSRVYVFTLTSKTQAK